MFVKCHAPLLGSNSAFHVGYTLARQTKKKTGWLVRYSSIKRESSEQKNRHIWFGQEWLCLSHRSADIFLLLCQKTWLVHSTAYKHCKAFTAEIKTKVMYAIQKNAAQKCYLSEAPSKNNPPPKPSKQHYPLTGLHPQRPPLVSSHLPRGQRRHAARPRGRRRRLSGGRLCGGRRDRLRGRDLQVGRGEVRGGGGHGGGGGGGGGGSSAGYRGGEEQVGGGSPRVGSGGRGGRRGVRGGLPGVQQQKLVHCFVSHKII